MRRIDLTKAQAARSSTIRGINRQFVLNYIRDREPVSRADIARGTELQRSTVSTIVEELKAEGLVEEIGAGASTGGRRPTLIRLRAAGAMAVGVAITPTATTVVTSDLVGRVIARGEVENSPRPDEMAARVVARVREMAAGDQPGRLAGVGVSLPGLVDTATGRAVYIPFFRWRDWAVAEEVERATGLQTSADNDANAAALAELWFGRPEVSGSRDFVVVLVAEGVGTGIVFDRQIYRGERGAAGEFGHGSWRRHGEPAGGEAKMRSRSLLIPFLLLLAVTAPGQEPTEKELMALKGEVKTVRRKFVEVTQRDGKLFERQLASETLVTLDRLGRKTEESFYDPDGTIYERQVFTYDDAGNRTQKRYDSEGRLLYEATSKLEFDKDGSTSRQITDGASPLFQGEATKLHSETVRKYDSRGRWVESLTYQRGTVTSRSVNRFGDDGGLDEFILYNRAGLILQRHVRTSEGMQVSVYKDDGTLLTTELRRKPTPSDFDAHGNWTRSVSTKTLNKDGKVEEVAEVEYRVITYY